MATRNGLTGAFWPNDAQELLLRAVLLDGDPGDEAWRTLGPSFDSQRFESGSLGLLALLYEKYGAADPHLARLKGVRRFLWYGDQVGLEVLGEALGRLNAHGVPTIVLGAGALIERYYRRQGVCPLVQPAVLVRPEAVPAAAESLSGAGFRPAARPTGRHQLFAHSRGAVTRTLALHWRLAPELEPLHGDEATNESVWRAAETVNVQGATTRVVSAADELLATCVIGARSRARPDFQWIVDAFTIVATSRASIDWDRIVAEAATRRCSLRLRDALHFLDTALDADLPTATLDALAATPTTRRESVAQRLAGHGARFAGNLPATLATHLVAGRDESIPRLVLGVPRYLGAEWGLDGPSQLPGAVGRRVVTSLSAARARRHAPS